MSRARPIQSGRVALHPVLRQSVAHPRQFQRQTSGQQRRIVRCRYATIPPDTTVPPSGKRQCPSIIAGIAMWSA